MKKTLLIIRRFLPSFFYAGFIAALVFGIWIRLSNFGHTGFYFDVITTQYTWGKAVFDMGFISFWRDYSGYFDYLPGALYLDTIVYAISQLWGGSEQAFAFVLKVINSMSEVVFAGLVFYVARSIGAFSKQHAFALATCAFVLPSFWFVSAIWGQIDSIVVTMTLIALTFFFRADAVKSSTHRAYYIFGSGVLFATAFWIKMQPIIVLPATILLFLSHRNMPQKIRFFVMGGIIATLVIVVAPLLVNPHRLGYVITTPFTRDNIVSRSASTFWTLTDISKHAYFNEKYHQEVAFLVISLSGAALYAFCSLLPVFVLYRINIKQIFVKTRSFSRILRALIPRPLTYTEFMLIASVSAIAYFEFMVKMYERYLHFGTMLSVIALAALGRWKYSPVWLLGVMLLNLGNVLNLLNVYVWWGYTKPEWLIHWYQSLNFDKDTASSVLTLGAMFMCMLLVFAYSRHKKTNDVF